MREVHMAADTILHNAKIATSGVPSFVEAIAISSGKISAAGTNDEIMRQRESSTRESSTIIIDAKGRTVIPGLNDSHMHPIRGGLNFNMELRWDMFVVTDASGT
jgi:predicted amidohydrolase YtcJ